MRSMASRRSAPPESPDSLWCFAAFRTNPQTADELRAFVNAFRGIGASQNASIQAYAPGIAEALVATAAGLAAAIPALIGYNHFQRRLRSIETRLEEFTADFIHRVQGRRS